MRHIFRISIFFFAVSLLGACRKDNMKPEEGDSVMSFNLSSPGVKTKASCGAFETGDKAGIYITDYVDGSTPMPLQISGNRANNLAIECSGAGWTPERTVYWGEGKSDVYAYYPYIEDITDVNEQPFEVNSYEDPDFLWAKAEGVSRTDGAVNLQMKHIMSKLTVRIVAGEDYVGSLPEDATVLLHSTVTAAKIDLESGSAVKDPYGSARSIKMKNLGIKEYDGVKAVVYEAIVVPQMLETSVPLIEINSKSVSYLLEDSFNFRPGVSYVYTATLNTSTTAIKIDIGCEVDDWNSTGGSGSGGDDSGESGDDGEDDGIKYTDLSAEGTANCYLVQGAGNYKFRAVLGNTDGTVGNVKSVDVLWESFGTDVMPEVGDLIAKASYKNGYVRFSTPDEFRQGNAVIAARNSSGTILWSWHIWLASEGWKEQVYYNDAGTMMDRNLGATSATPGEVGAFGLMYQGCRKDPFLGASSVDSNVRALSTGTWSVDMGEGISIALAEENPMTFYTRFVSGNWSSEKTVSDPCPAGWKVPQGGREGVWAKASGETDSSLNIEGCSYGLNFSGIFGSDETIWYPASGTISSEGLLNVGSYGQYWHARVGGLASMLESLHFYSSGYVLFWSSQWVFSSVGSAVRCIKEQ